MAPVIIKPLDELTPEEATIVYKATSVVTPAEERIILEPMETRSYAVSEELVTTADAFTDIMERPAGATAPERLINIPERTVRADEGVIPVQKTEGTVKEVINFESDIDAALYAMTARANRAPKKALMDFLESNFNLTRDELMDLGKRVRKAVRKALKDGNDVPTLFDSVIDEMNLPRPTAIVDLVDPAALKNVTGKVDGALAMAYNSLDDQTSPLAKQLKAALDATDPVEKARILREMQRKGELPSSTIGAKVDIERRAQKVELERRLIEAETGLKKAEANLKRIQSDNARKEKLGQPLGSTKKAEAAIADWRTKLEDARMEREGLDFQEREAAQRMSAPYAEDVVLSEKAHEFNEKVKFNPQKATETALQSMYRRLNSLKKITNANEDLGIPLEAAITSQSASYRESIEAALAANKEITTETFVTDQLTTMFKDMENYVESGVLTREQFIEWEGKTVTFKSLLEKKAAVDTFLKNEPALLETAVVCLLGGDDA